jgi:regulator of replication initiation timing
MKEMCDLKLFTFNASSFTLGSEIEEFLRSKSAIILDFGGSAYINSDTMPAILSELIAKSTQNSSNALQDTTPTTTSTASTIAITQLKSELDAVEADRQKLKGENINLGLQVQSYLNQIAALRDQLSKSENQAQLLKAENTKLQASISNGAALLQAKPSLSASSPPTPQLSLSSSSTASLPSIDALRQANEKMQKELQLLKAHNAELITTLKVMEEENEQLQTEVEKYQNQLKSTPIPKAGT